MNVDYGWNDGQPNNAGPVPQVCVFLNSYYYISLSKVTLMDDTRCDDPSVERQIVCETPATL